MNEIAAKSVLLLIATLFLAVLFVEYRRHKNCPPSMQPPPAGKVLPFRTNVPFHRPSDVTLHDVSYIDVDTAAGGVK